MDMTPRWALPLLFAGQAQKELFHNEALATIDALLHGRAESADLPEPPAAPEPGQCWIVAEGGMGDWAGRDGDVACWTDGGWRFTVPAAGLTLDIGDRDHGLFHDGVEWRASAVRDDGFYLDDQRIVGERQDAIAGPEGGAVIDEEARSSINMVLAVLRVHGLIHS
ncbi:hypothetical protein J3E64_000376 [Sphingobium sp. OAS761]|uniref:DUF2793 domain-containing protein n=1 Tax=Sphingobium sp. OAS761 TaxID=2817901 RepID=UPI0020A0F132|nr:DUF2793 domain-containing protein [Sphingobium sp. OAS761]MCP1468709.1 hypothetical protein [Sphingobium sp. OAS761]